MKKIYLIINFIFIFSLLSFTNSKASPHLEEIYSDKLTFKHYPKYYLGNFTGIMENNKRIRGINLSKKWNGNTKSDFIGTFTRQNTFWKGYYKHQYKNRSPLYQYLEYANNGGYKVVHSKKISEPFLKNSRAEDSQRFFLNVLFVSLSQ